MGADQAVGILDRIAEQSPVIALLGLIILALIGALCWIVRHFVGQIDAITTSFSTVMAENSERNFTTHKAQLAQSIEETKVQSRLATLIETRIQ